MEVDGGNDMAMVEVEGESESKEDEGVPRMRLLPKAAILRNRLRSSKLNSTGRGLPEGTMRWCLSRRIK